jgi:hypothetical protein
MLPSSVLASFVPIAAPALVLTRVRASARA